MHVNVDSTKDLLKCAQTTDSVVAFVYTPSTAIIHDNKSDLIDEKEMLQVVDMRFQRQPYARTKTLAETLVLDANCKNGEMPTASMRLSGLSGENGPTKVQPMINVVASGRYKY